MTNITFRTKAHHPADLAWMLSLERSSDQNRNMEAEEYFYEVDLTHEPGRAGRISSHGLQPIDVIADVKPPRERKTVWSPEHLLAASVSDSFMSTFLDLCEKMQVNIQSYQSQCFVKLVSQKDKFVVTELLLRPIIRLDDHRSMLKAYKYIEEAESLCPVRNVLKISVEVHPQFEYIDKGSKVKV